MDKVFSSLCFLDRLCLNFEQCETTMDKVFSSLFLLDRLDLNFVIETKGFMTQLKEMKITQSFEHINIIII